MKTKKHTTSKLGNMKSLAGLEKEIEKTGVNKYNWKVCYVNQDGVVFDANDEIIGEYDIEECGKLKATLTQTNEIIELIREFQKEDNDFMWMDKEELLTKIMGDGE